MGLYIPGMELPEKGKYRTIIIYDDGTVCAHYEDRQLGKAVPVPVHGRLISAELLKAEFTGNFRDAYETALVKALIDCSPTIIPTEEKPLDCPSCGGKGTVVGFRTGANEHFRGACAACGARIME